MRSPVRSLFDQEISDAIVSFAPGTLTRQRVERDRLVAEFRAAGDERAARIVAELPVDPTGALDNDTVDALLIRVHAEIQRVSEEFMHGERVAQLLQPLAETLCSVDGASRRPLRIVDIGCGTGYVVRWLAAWRGLGPNVELIGADFNPALVETANTLAREEGLDCRFVVADAFFLDQPASIYMSTGVVHHFRGEALSRFFAAHVRQETLAFLHFDFQPSPMASLGAWVFHVLRMREPLSRHDGVLSAIRVHDARTLREAAAASGPEFSTAIYGARLWGLPIPRAFHTLVGVRHALRDRFLRTLGPGRRARFGPWSNLT